jgi:hypothetical protein
MEKRPRGRGLVAPFLSLGYAYWQAYLSLRKIRPLAADKWPSVASELSRKRKRTGDDLEH